MTTIKEIKDANEKRQIARSILEELTEWFEVREYREEFIEKSGDKLFLCAFEDDKPAGFICLTETGKDTVEIYVLGVLKEYHKCGIGRKLVEEVRRIGKENGYSFLQVKTVRMGMYEEYDRTNRFYLAVGFKEFEVFPDLWDEANPCQVYVMSLKDEV